MRVQIISDVDTLTLIDDRLDNRGDAWIRLNGDTGLMGGDQTT